MRYQVPQFIEVEDKIFGPLTLKQFIYVAGGIGASIALYLFLPWYLFTVPILVILGFSLALAFYKINNRPFIFAMESWFNYTLHPKLYIWHKEEQNVALPTAENETEMPTSFIPKLGDSKLKDLAWTLDVRQAENPVTSDARTNTK